MAADPGKSTLFIILPRIPYPLEKGDKLRAYHQVRELSRYFNLVICALSDRKPHPEAMGALQPYAEKVYFMRLSRILILLRLVGALFTSYPFQTAYFFSKRIKKKIGRLVQLHQPDHLFCQLIRTAPYAKNLPVRKTIDYQDAFSAGLKRRLQGSPWYMRLLINTEYKRVQRFETKVFDWFDNKTIISFSDRELLPLKHKTDVVVVPNGVDIVYFKPTLSEKQFDIVFTGNMGYPPNVRCAEFLVQHIMPLVWKERPETTVVIAGAYPSQGVRALASDKVTVTGWVADIRPYYNQSRVFLAPMQIGTGLQNKVLEAMAMKLPCITSDLANQAINASEGSSVLIGRNTIEYAQHVLSLLRNPELAQVIGNNGHDFVSQSFNWESTTAILRKVICSQV